VGVAVNVGNPVDRQLVSAPAFLALQFDGNMATQLIDPESALHVGNLVLEPIVRANAAALFDALRAPRPLQSG
jgi:hypothetical protein